MYAIENTSLTLDQITQADRRRGYVPRYFAAQINHIRQEVFEVTLRDYNFFYNVRDIIVGHLNWAITGPLDDGEMWIYTGSPIYNRGGTEPISIPGVLTQNRGSVRFLSRKIPAVKNYLTDYKQFYDET